MDVDADETRDVVERDALKIDIPRCIGAVLWAVENGRAFSNVSGAGRFLNIYFGFGIGDLGY